MKQGLAVRTSLPVKLCKPPVLQSILVCLTIQQLLMRKVLFTNMDNLMEKIISLAKRRGFIFQSSEIYGGFESCYDYGPLGVELKNNIKRAWWNEMIKSHENIVGLDAAILMSPKVWEA